MKAASFLILVASSAFADLRLPHVISDHMVLQAGTQVEIWGWGEPDDTVTVEISGQLQKTVVTSERHWRVTLDSMKASEAAVEMRLRSISASGHTDEIRVSDVLIGEVWLASGQSNMEMQLKGKAHGSVLNADLEIAHANFQTVRMFAYEETYSIYDVNVPPDSSQSDRRGAWHVCSPETVAEFSAIGYFFARDLVNQLKSPVGILSVSVGGTPIEAWTSSSAQGANPLLQPMLESWAERIRDFEPAKASALYAASKADWLRRKAEALKAGQSPPKAPASFKNLGVMRPGCLFNSLIAPVIPDTVRGVIWYQGERNAAGDFTGLYGDQLETLVRDWRERWGKELYFAWVQLPGFLNQQTLPSERNGWGVYAREGMRRALSLPNTGMAITVDIGDPKEGHPRNKADFAARLSSVVLHDVYESRVPFWTGPLLKQWRIEQGRIVLTFDHGEGLKARNGPLVGFAVAGEDQKFVWAEATITNHEVVVASPMVKAPVAVRYGWGGNPRGNLLNGGEFPASPFRTDNW